MNRIDYQTIGAVFMDKSTVIKAVQSSKIDTVVISSFASPQEREKLIQSFTRKIPSGQAGEVVLVIIQR